MKTIKMVSSELAPSFWKDERGQVMHLRDISEKAFEAGAEFVQRWISVEEEFPPTISGFEGKLILKNDKEIIGIGHFDSNGCFYFLKNGTYDRDDGYGNINYSHWRPIELV